MLLTDDCIEEMLEDLKVLPEIDTVSHGKCLVAFSKILVSV